MTTASLPTSPPEMEIDDDFLLAIGDVAERLPDPRRPGNGGGAAVTEKFRPTDLWVARRFVERFRGRVLYCDSIGGWLVYDGLRWKKSDCGELERLAKEMPQVIAELAFPEPEAEVRSKMLKFAAAMESASKIDAMLKLAATEEGIAVRPEVFDADPWQFNTVGGTYCLRTGECHPHDPEDRITKLVPFAPDPDAPRPTFTAFLDRIMGGNANLIGYLKRLFGYCLTGDISEHVFPIFHGVGANGKSTLLELMFTIAGDYAATINFTSLAVQRHADNTRNDLAALKGTRLVVVDEGAEGARINEELVKKLTGSKTIKCRFLFHEFFEYSRQFKIITITNHKPQVRGTDNAIWRRVQLVPFDVTIPEEEQDKNLGEKLLAEGPAILAWLIEGCLAWQREGFGVPDEVRTATKKYREEEDVIAQFLDDECVIDKAKWAVAGDLYKRYTAWAGKMNETGERPLSQKVFGGRLAERGFEPDRGTGGKRKWKGVGLKADEGTNAAAAEGVF